MLHESEAAIVTLAEALLDANPAVRVDDTHTAARLVVAAIESLVHRLIASPTPIEVAPFENELVAMLTKYLTG
jgi:Tetracyclin repressor-like, C-terminal domain